MTSPSLREPWRLLALRTAVLGTIAASLLAVSPAQAAPTPQSGVLNWSPEGQVRVFSRATPALTPMAEVTVRNEGYGKPSINALIGTYLRPHPNLRLGLFYRRQHGVRNNEDWIYQPTTGTAAWGDSLSRGENLAVVDVTPRVAAGDAWVAELKTRYSYNFTFLQHSLLVRPGIYYFWLNDAGDPVATLFAQAEWTFPLGFGNTLTNDRWYYVGALRPLCETLSLGIHVAYRSWTFSSSPSFTAQTGETFAVTQQSLVTGLTLIVELGDGS